MARPTIYLPDELLRDARAAKVNVSGAAREGIAARTYGRGVLVPADWYEMALRCVGGDGPGTEAPRSTTGSSFHQQVSMPRTPTSSATA